ncbi:MAG: hypothetical protein JSV23_02265 [Promethearchaeota archaeon]|nr:MAG: hypothetical protein JSV23_02265 [Candidatus Lokiarchaeota archaeon]
MKESLTPEKIQKDFSTGDLSKENAAELLISLIESSDNAEIRVDSIKALEKINFQNENIFKILENYLISDENAVIRASVASYIIENFPEDGLSAFRWVIQHEDSPLVMKIFFDAIEKLGNPQLKLIEKDLTNWIDKYATKIGIVPREAIFFLDLEACFAKGKRKYKIDPIFYKHFEKLSNIKNGEPWLVIKNKHVNVLNLNYFTWKWVKENSDIVNSLYKFKYLDAYFNSLNKYNINDKDFFEIPNSIGKLTYLKKLTLMRNRLQKIPESLGALNSLKELDLSYNNFYEIPQIIGGLNSLEKLNLKGNKIQKIPDSLRLFLDSLENFIY